MAVACPSFLPASMKQKDRMVSFRLSAEEYDRLRQAGSAQGVHNLSELARAAMRRLLESNGHALSARDNLSEHSDLPAQVRELRVRIDQLSSELERMSRVLPPER